MAKSGPYKRWYVAATCVAVIVVCGLFLQMVSRTVGLKGEMTTSANFHKPGLYIGDIIPLPLAEEAVRFGKKWETVLDGWPAFIDVMLMAQFDDVRATLQYRASGLAGQAVRGLRLGALASADSNEFVTVLGSRLLGELQWKVTREADWDVYRSGAVGKGVVRALGVSVPVVPAMSGYAAKNVMRSFHANVRGHHRILTYAENEKLRFLFSVQDMNRDVGADDVVVTVTDVVSGKVIKTVRVADDGDVSLDQKQTGLIPVNVETGVLPKGVYQVDVMTSDDVFIRDFATTQQKFVFRERMLLGDVIGYAPTQTASSLLVYGTTVDARLEHPRAAQTLKIGTENVPLALQFQMATTRIPENVPTTVVSPKNEVALVTDGVIGISQETMFEPIMPLVSLFDTEDEVLGKGVTSLVVGHDTVMLHDAGSIMLPISMSRLEKTKATDKFRFSIEPILVPGATPTNAFAVRDFSLTFTRQSTSLWYSVTHIDELLHRKVAHTDQPLLYGKTYGHID